MGKKEEPMIHYYENEKHFAELLNGWLFEGQEEILPEQIHTAVSRYTAKSGKGRRVRYRTRYRDIVKKVDGFQVRLILGIEIQSYVDYAMPVRIMDYDVVEYGRQVSSIRYEHSHRNPKKVYLSGLQKTDRLTPVLTLVLYLGEEKWDASENLHGILDFDKVPEKLKKYIPDYPVYVLDVYHTADERLMEFPGDMACMFLILKYQKDKEKLLKIIEDVPEFQHVDEELYDTVWTYTNSKEFLTLKDRISEEGGLNMCQAIRELVAEVRAEGKVEGKAEGKTEGMERVNKLIICLSAENRFQDLARAARDAAYQNELFQFYGI